MSMTDTIRARSNMRAQEFLEELRANAINADAPPLTIRMIDVVLLDLANRPTDDDIADARHFAIIDAAEAFGDAMAAAGISKKRDSRSRRWSRVSPR